MKKITLSLLIIMCTISCSKNDDGLELETSKAKNSQVHQPLGEAIEITVLGILKKLDRTGTISDEDWEALDFLIGNGIVRIDLENNKKLKLIVINNGLRLSNHILNESSLQKSNDRNCDSGYQTISDRFENERTGDIFGVSFSFNWNNERLMNSPNTSISNVYFSNLMVTVDIVLPNEFRQSKVYYVVFYNALENRQEYTITGQLNPCTNQGRITARTSSVCLRN